MRDAIAAALADLPQFKRGLLFCHVCGATAKIGDVSNRLAKGWPKCCGYTMSLDSPEEKQGAAKS